MKNLLNEQLCIWLEKYCQQSTNRPIQELAQRLLVQVSSTFTLSELIDVLKTSTSKPSYAQSIYFYSALCDWQKRLEQRLNEHETACRRIEGIKYSPRIEPLIGMMRELLAEPLISLHVQASQLLRFINNPSFEEVIGFIAKQKIKLPPSLPESVCNKRREFAKCLLEALTKQQKGAHPLLNDAYGLIEAVLVFYNEEMHLVEINLDEVKPTPIEVEKIRPSESCVLL